MSRRRRRGPVFARVALALSLMTLGCAARTPPLHVAGAPQELQAAHDALLRAQRGEAAAFAPKELMAARSTLSRALTTCAAAPAGACHAAALAYGVRREVQLAEALAGQRASQARSSELQLALSTLQEAAASDAWDTGEAQNHLPFALSPVSTQLLPVPGRDAVGTLSADHAGAAATAIDLAELFDEGSSTLTARGAQFAEAVAVAAAARASGSASLLLRLQARPGASPGLTRARCLALAAYLRAQGSRLHCVGAGCSTGGAGSLATAPLLWHIRAAAAR